MQEKICRECGAKFTITDKRLEFYKNEGLNEPTHCPECRQLKRRTEAVSCKDCGKVFTMNGLEMKSYEQNGLKLPKRCPECRRKRREANKNA